jgi:hypothetical protein
LLLKGDPPVDALKRPKKDPCAPKRTLISAFPDRHGCGFAAGETDPWRPSEASKFRDMFAEAAPLSAFIPRLTCGMRWADALSVAPEFKLALNVTSVIDGIQVSSINMDSAAIGDDEIVKVKLTLAA